MTTLMHAPPLKIIEFSLCRFCSQNAFLKYRRMEGWLKGISLFKFIYNETEWALHTPSSGSLDVIDKGYYVMNFEITASQAQ